jgi:hypothetical protein
MSPKTIVFQFATEWYFLSKEVVAPAQDGPETGQAGSCTAEVEHLRISVLRPKVCHDL